MIGGQDRIGDAIKDFAKLSVFVFQSPETNLAGSPRMLRFVCSPAAFDQLVLDAGEYRSPRVALGNLRQRLQSLWI